jgi:hypothetical protein
MNTERQRQRLEDERQDNENKRQAAEKEREVGELLRQAEHVGERFIVDYSTRALITQIESFEERLSLFASRLENIEALMNEMRGYFQQLVNSDT